MRNNNLNDKDAGYDAGRSVPFVGRKSEMETIDRAARADSLRVVPVIGEGGSGKTRLLKEVRERYSKDSSKFAVAREVIDFYHIANHSVEGLMDAIYCAFRSDEVKLDHYEAARQKLDRYLAEPPSSGGASPYPNLLKDSQDALVADLSLLAKRLILVFDTAEKLVYGITDVERVLGLTQEQLGIWRWLHSDFVPRLKNALVIVAGRPASEPLLANLQVTKVPLGNFDEPDALAYIDAVAENAQARRPNLARRIEAWSEQDRIDIIRQAKGRPILLAMMIDCLSVSPQQNLSRLGAEGELEEKLSAIIANTDRPQDEVIRAVAQTRKGMTPELLARLLKLETPDGGWDIAAARKQLGGISDLSFVKSFGDDRVFLHDETYRFMEEYVLRKKPSPELKSASGIIAEYCHDSVMKARARLEDAREKHDYRAVRKETEALQAELAEDLHYQLRADANHGFETYYRYAEEALQANDMGLDAQLRAELLTFWTERDPDDKATEVDGLSRSQLNADGALRWVRRRVAASKYGVALELASAVKQTHLISEEKQLAALELDVWALSAQVYTEKSPESVEANLERAITKLEVERQHTITESERQRESWRVSCVLAHAYNRIGYLQSMVGRQHAAIDSYGKAVPLWRILNLEAAQANTLNNQAFALSNIGNFDRATRLAKDALDIRERLGNRSAIGLSFNARALIEMQHGDLHQAEALSKLAFKKFLDGGDERGLALARVALAEIRRRQATEGEQLPATEKEKRLRKAIADAKAASRGFKRIPERVRYVETLIQLGCAYRDLMYLRREFPGKETVEELTSLARKTFSEARKQVGEKGLQALDAWVREAWTDYYLASYYRRMAKNRNLVLAEEALSQVGVCLGKANALFDEQYRDYRITVEQRGSLRDRNRTVMPVLTQIAKIELLKGQMAFNRFENCRAEMPEECAEAYIAIQEGTECYTLSMEYDDIASPGFNFRDMRRAKDRIYERLKKLNAREWQVVYQAVLHTEKTHGLSLGGSAMSRFLEQNFGAQEELEPIPMTGSSQ